MYKKIIILGCVLAVTSIVLGAYAAHGLENYLSEKMHKTFETGCRYQMYHAFGILLCGLLYHNHLNKKFIIASYLFLLGIVLFSGSLYALAVLSIGHGTNYNFIGAITPFGGLCFIVGWLYLVIALSKMK